MIQHQIKTQKTAYYYSLGDLNKKTKEIWLLCHGYGQLAEYFIKKFKIITQENRYIIAPEGLSKFYINGYDGRVGASWMTKKNRSDEIKDYCLLLDNLIVQTKKKASKSCKLNVFGFSQGTATISRWVLRTSEKINKMILWGGYIANDFDFEKYSIEKKQTKNYIVFGNNDQFYSKKNILKYKKEIKNFNAIWIEYNGTHKIDSEMIKIIANNKN